MGVALIQRSTRSFALTEADIACYNRSRKLVAEAKRIQEEIGGFASHPTGHLRIGIAADLAQTLFSSFLRENRGMTLEILSTPMVIPICLRKRRIWQFLCPTKCLSQLQPFCPAYRELSRKLFAAEPYLSGRPALDDPSDFSQHDCILLYGTLQHQWELTRGREHRIVKVSGMSSANTIGMLTQLSREQMRIAILPDFLALHPGFGGGLSRVLPEWVGVPSYVLSSLQTRFSQADPTAP